MIVPCNLSAELSHERFKNGKGCGDCASIINVNRTFAGHTKNQERHGDAVIEEGRTGAAPWTSP